MRLFIGIEIGDEARAAAVAAARALRVRVERPEWGVAARWISAENLHITLWFLGEVADGGRAEAGRHRSAGSILEVMAPRFDMPRFLVALAGLGVFPSSGPPRVFWLGVQSGAVGLSDLHAQIAARLAPLGFEPEDRPYSAHLTLARVKWAGCQRSAALRAMIGDVPAGPASFRVDGVTLFQSRLSPKGAAYDPILRVPLS